MKYRKNGGLMEQDLLFQLSIGQCAWIIIAAVLVGFSKTGISAVMMPVIPIVAMVFGGKESTGILLPMLIIGDIMALWYYKRHGAWNDIKKLLPWTFVGLILGIVVGNYVNDIQFKAFISVSIFICLVILIYTEKKGDNLKIPSGKWFYALTGVAAGFTSMIGNAAGPLFSVYLLAKGFKKDNFLGTTAWFFFTINLSKVPLQIFFWNNISFKMVGLALMLIPAIVIGAILGAKIVKKLNEKAFRYIIIVMTAISAIRLLI